MEADAAALKPFGFQEPIMQALRRKRSLRGTYMQKQGSGAKILREKSF